MPLFNNFPYSNLHELNLDWIISKLKDVDKAQITAQEANTLLNQVSGKADEAAESARLAAGSADAAASSAHDADLSAFGAYGAASAASDDAQIAVNAKNDAVSAKTDAESARDTAVSAKDTAVSSASDAHDDAVAAAASAAAALADANRAQSYGASTGVKAFAGQISAGSAADIAVPDGTYSIIYFADDSNHSSGVTMFTLKTNQTVYRGRVITYNGSNIVVTAVSNTGIRIINNMADGDMRYLVIGYAD